MDVLPRQPARQHELPGWISQALDGAGGNYPSLKLMASRLCLSPRTLKRRLRAQGLSFRDLLDGARYRVALRLMPDRTLGLDDIASQLGYSSVANFARAFRRWSGLPPGVYRTRNLLSENIIDKCH